MAMKNAPEPILAEINITPFTDVLLVLLIIFMILAALVVPPGFEKRLGSCACGSLVRTRPPKAIEIIVTRSGQIVVGGQKTSISGLYPLLAWIHAKVPREKAELTADAKAPYGAVIRVLDAAKESGIADVSFVVR